MKILIANSNISSNIGNDFFYRGIKYALEKLIPNVQIFDGYFSPFNAYKLSEKEKALNFDYFSEVEGLDAIVIAGPVLDRDFSYQFSNTLKRAKKAGLKIFLLSVGGREYDREEIETCRGVLEKYKPDIFISRDTDTFNNYQDLAKNSYNGICFAFFVNDYYPGYSTPSLDKYIVSCLDFSCEPDLNMFAKKLNANDDNLNLTSHTTRSLLNKIKYVTQRNFLKTAGDFKIIRTCHRPLRHKKAIFFRENILSAFNSDPYLNLYKNANLTVTDRLHAAVVTLCFGNKACLLLNSNRTRLLDRAGVSKCINNIFQIDSKHLSDEKEKQLKFIKAFTQGIINE
jgi:polysaccharide pyruvyl transferase WcaK-like protein